MILQLKKVFQWKTLCLNKLEVLLKPNIAAQLVERNLQPNGVELLDPRRVSKHNQMDIISLASQIQQADKQLKSGTCQKLCLILDQAC